MVFFKLWHDAHGMMEGKARERIMPSTEITTEIIEPNTKGEQLFQSLAALVEEHGYDEIKKGMEEVHLLREAANLANIADLRESLTKTIVEHFQQESQLTVTQLEGFFSRFGIMVSSDKAYSDLFRDILGGLEYRGSHYIYSERFIASDPAEDIPLSIEPSDQQKREYAAREAIARHFANEKADLNEL